MEQNLGTVMKAMMEVARIENQAKSIGKIAKSTVANIERRNENDGNGNMTVTAIPMNTAATMIVLHVERRKGVRSTKRKVRSRISMMINID